VMEFLKKMNEEQGKTIIMVTHDANVAKHADRIELLKDGVIVETRTNHKGNGYKAYASESLSYNGDSKKDPKKDTANNKKVRKNNDKEPKRGRKR